jgi:hypothetical protein
MTNKIKMMFLVNICLIMTYPEGLDESQRVLALSQVVLSTG